MRLIYKQSVIVRPIRFLEYYFWAVIFQGDFKMNADQFVSWLKGYLKGIGINHTMIHNTFTGKSPDKIDHINQEQIIEIKSQLSLLDDRFPCISTYEPVKSGKDKK